MGKTDDSEYSVGYKRPPRHTRFKPGQSGNAMGRPKKDNKLVDVMLKELRSSVVITVGSKSQKVTKLEAIVKQHINKAAQGDAKSTALVLSVLRPGENGQGDKLHELLQEFREKNRRHVADDGPGRAAKDDNSERSTSLSAECKRKERNNNNDL